MDIKTRRILSKIYFSIPFKKQIFLTLRRYLKIPISLTRYLRFKGIIEVQLDIYHSFKIHHYGFEIENSLFWHGLNGWEKTSLNIWLLLSRHCNTIMDIGSNTGVYALIAKAVNPESDVYAFEPVKRVFNKLIENIKLNEFNIKPIEKAVSNFDGKATIYDPGTDHLYSVTVNKNMNASNQTCEIVEIETVTLATFISENKLKSIDLIKIDVETHEPEVFEGFKDYLQFFSPIILIEILNEEVGSKINIFLKDLEYLCYSIDEINGCRKEEKVEARNNRNYLLIPKKKSEMIDKISLNSFIIE